MAFNLIQLVGSLIGILTASAGAIFAWIYHFQSLAMLLLGILLGAFLTFVRKNVLSLRDAPPRWVQRGYRDVRIDVLYVIHADDPKHHTLTVETEIEAIQSGVSIYEEAYHWTGKGEENEPQVVSPGHTIIARTIRQDGWKLMYILLGHELNKGARTIIKTIRDLYDSANNFDPHLGKVISMPTDYMVLHVILPKALFPAHIFFREWSAVGPAGRIIREIAGEINKHSGEIRWEISSPVFGYRYSIDWKY